MKYAIFDKESNDLIDVLDFSTDQKKKYEKSNPDHILVVEDDLAHDVLEDDDFIDEYYDDEEF